MVRVMVNLFFASMLGIFSFYFAIIVEQYSFTLLQQFRLNWQGMDTQIISAWFIKLIIYTLCGFILFLFVHASNLNHWLWMCIIALIAAYGFYGVQSSVELLDRNYLVDWCKLVLPAPLGLLIGGKFAIRYRIKKYDF